ncbi:MAG: CPP1-like family protein [Snowella sp.]|nr:CPP1-like family protein [Snowella sp.]
MSEPTPYQTLGVTEDSSFEEIQAVKIQLSQKYQGDSRALELVESAYDAILMDRLKLRQEGKIKVPDRIRFPERVMEQPTASPSFSVPNSPSWLQGLIDTPSRNDILLPAGVFATLAGISASNKDTTGSFGSLLLVIGVFASIYFIYRKERKIGRAFLLTLIALLAGVALGMGVSSLLTASGLAIGLGSEQISCVVTFILFWVVSSFLR